MAARNWRLVYGAGDIGLMGAVANATQTAGGETSGLSRASHAPRSWQDRPLALYRHREHARTQEGHVHELRRHHRASRGAGSLDEFFEVLTWRQLGLHEKPIFLANINGYWDPLVGLVDHVISEGFADASLRDFIQVVDDLTTLEDGLVRAFS